MSCENMRRWILQSLVLVVAVISVTSNGAVFHRGAVNNITVKSLADCQTAPDGDYPHPSSCTKFINCQNGLGAEVTCQLFLHFNWTSRRCDFHPQNAGCALANGNGNGNVTMPRPGEPVNCPKLFNGDYAHPTDCSKFITCSNGYRIVQSCAANLVFDFKSKICQFQNIATCGSIPSTTAPKPATTTAAPFTCINGLDGDYPHSRDCTKFLRCLNGLKQELSCSRFLHFNATSRKCEFHPENAGCSTAKVTGEVNPPAPGEAVNCPKLFNGNYPHPLNCSLYITCFNGHSTLRFCPETLLYDVSIGSCLDAANATCVIPVPVTVKSLSDCINAPNGNYPHPHDCNKFISCTNGRGGVIYCPNHLHFNETSRRCDFHPENAGCALAVVTGKVPRPKPGEQVQCFKLFDGRYPHPTDCRKFISCATGFAYEFFCGSNLYYDYKKDRCDHPANASCGSLPTTAPPAPKPSKPVNGPVDCNTAHPGYYQHHSNCSLYVLCVHRFKFVGQCPKGLHWSQAAKVCDVPNQANCNALTQKTAGSPVDCNRKPNGNYPHEQQCSLFITCSNGYRYVRSCPIGLHWSPTLNRCETTGKANCNLKGKPAAS